MTSLTQWTWVWVNSGSWWWTGRPGVLQSGCKELDMTERLNRTEKWLNPYGRKQRTKEPFGESERGDWKIWLKNQHSKTKTMSSSLITSWQIDGETMETVTDLIFLGSKITADGDCSHEIKRYLLLGRKTMTNLDSVLKSWDITLTTNVCLVKAMVFPVVIYRWECWTIKKAELWRIDIFELWCWRRLLRAPWTARRSNQSI